MRLDRSEMFSFIVTAEEFELHITDFALLIEKRNREIFDLMIQEYTRRKALSDQNSN